MSQMGNFIKYNNIVPITISVMLLGAASTYAANNPEAIVDKKETVVSIDNTYISTIDLKNFTPSVSIISVEEDDETYFVTYDFTTIELVDAVWQDVTIQEVMEIPKSRLGQYRDLGLYVTGELNEKIKSEIRRLSETQVIEKKQLSTKKVATEYSGIVGGFLSSKVTEIARYKPVIKPPKPKQEVQTFARPDPLAKPPKPPKIDVPVPPVVEEVPVEVPPETEVAGAATTTPDAPPAAANEAPVLTILGDNPIRIALNEVYTDLGATVVDDVDRNLTVAVYVDGAPVSSVVLDTSVVASYSVVYEAIDLAGATARVERIVEVYDPTPVDVPDSNPNPGQTGSSSEPAPPVETPPEVTEPLIEPPAEPVVETEPTPVI